MGIIFAGNFHPRDVQVLVDVNDFAVEMLPVGQDSDQPTFIANQVGIGGDDPSIGDEETAAGSTGLAVDRFLS